MAWRRLGALPRLPLLARRLRRSPLFLPLGVALLLGVGVLVRTLSLRLAGDPEPPITGLGQRLLAGGLESLLPAAGPRLRGTLYQGIVLDRDQVLNAETFTELRSRVEELSRAFRTVHPEVNIQVQLFRSDTLIPHLRSRVRSGLGPDILLVSGLFANDLNQLGLTSPATLTAAEWNQINPSAMERLRLPNGQISGVPALFHPELACFNRSRLRSSPTTLDELLQRSAQGLRVGLGAHPFSIYWTAGSLGANDALVAAARGEALTPEQRLRLRGWVQWLQGASLQQRVTLFSDQNQVLKEFRRGQLDWISCNSIALPNLRAQMGSRLGVATLPSGPGGEPTPVSRERVMVFGRGSSPEQRRIAEAMVRFTINPLIQRTLTLDTMAVLPVNRFVPPPVNSSASLQAMVESQRQSNANTMLVELVHPGDARLLQLSQTMVQVVFGELEPDPAVEAIIRDLRPTPSRSLVGER
ncbi:MAG: extracellular solute-binding protein [Prochlorococcaceae cyanobacterium]|jgi:maltose-binding protein MalE